ncbi:hypothetical protein I4U23_004333 [Adineta vaga]|nr:hypothetical protein I4U23_004333 [Adineta vaga]
MVSLNSTEESSNEFNVRDVQAITNQLHASLDTNNFMDDVDEQKTRVQEVFEYVFQTHELLKQNLKSLISQLSADDILDSIKGIYEFKMKSDEIDKTVHLIERQIQDCTNEDQEDWREQLITMANNIDDDVNIKIKQLQKDIDEQKLKLAEIISNNMKVLSSQEQLRTNLVNDNLSVRATSPLMSIVSKSSADQSSSRASTPREFDTVLLSSSPALSGLLVKQMSPGIIDLRNHEISSEDKEDEDIIDPSNRPQCDGKIRLANNIVSCLRGPFKIVATGPLTLADALAKGRHVQETIIEAVKRKATKPNDNSSDDPQQPTKNSIKSPFVEITSDWKYEGANADAGFNSPSVWMRDLQDRRILMKTQDLPICAANEWLAYVLGVQIGLPINQVQIAVYENNLVTLHTDVAGKDEKCLTFMDLTKERGKKLLTDPILGSMHLFDRIIQNVDRNPRNILITIPKTADIEDDATTFKIHLIDHALCFGMGKLNGLSIIAGKFHTHHLSVGKFDPIHQTKKFERYLSKLSASDRVLMSKTLNRFAAITNEQIDSWITEIQSLLTSTQYNRIHSVLYLQRDLVKRYTMQWGISSKSSTDTTSLVTHL